jgi:signal transduction histidine kinase
MLKRTFYELRNEEIDTERIHPLFEKISNLAETLIIDEKGHIVSSSVPSSSLRDFLDDDRREYRYSYNYINTTAPDGKSYSVVVALPVEKNADSQRWYSMLLIPFPPLLFVIFMSIFIIRSINVSISRLEEATRNIIDGNLDFHLEAKGNDSIASLTRSFNMMRERVREETAARARFIMAISHDLKTPLSSITGYLDAIGDGMAASPENLDKYLSIIRDKTGLLESRIRQLIDFVKLETSEWKRSLQDVPVSSFLDEAITVFGVEAEALGFRLESRNEIDEDLEISMDSDLVFRAIENLVSNAFRYAEPGSAIGFKAWMEEGRVIIQIRNSGEEISSEDMPFIFEPFFRGTKSRRETGFGLGLATVKSVISSHGWEIGVLSKEGTTVFTISIPPSPLCEQWFTKH